MTNGNRLAGGVFWPHAGYVTDPARSAQNLAAAAARHGAGTRPGVEVIEILREGGRVKGVGLADGEEIHAPVVINVAGPGSAAVKAMADVTQEMTIATRPIKQEVVHVPAPAGFDFESNGTIVSDSDIACYCRPERGNHILVGSEGPDCDPHIWVDSDTEHDRNFADQWTPQAMRYAQRVPALGIPSEAKGAVGLHDASTDWIPIYDSTSLGGCYMDCGTSGNQYRNAPIAGKMMSALMDWREAGNDHDSDPFTLPCIERDINAGFHSRKREIDRESSFSVLG